MTPKQADMMNRIAHDEMTILNGGEPERYEDTDTFADGIILTQADKGTFTSLMNAGLVWHLHDDRRKDGRGDACGMTEKGFEAYKALRGQA